jgi:hypothetical protein
LVASAFGEEGKPRRILYQQGPKEEAKDKEGRPHWAFDHYSQYETRNSRDQTCGECRTHGLGGSLMPSLIVLTAKADDQGFGTKSPGSAQTQGVRQVRHAERPEV